MCTKAVEEAAPSEQFLNSSNKLLLKRLKARNTPVLHGADNVVIGEITKPVSFAEGMSATIEGLELDDAQAMIAAIRSVWTEWQAKYQQSNLGNT